MPTSPSTSKANGPPIESVNAMSPPDPPIHVGHLTDNVVIPSPDTVPAIGAVPDKLADAWDAVKDEPKIANKSQALDTVGVSPAPSFFFHDVLILDYR